MRYLALICLLVFTQLLPAQRQPLILDADTANEVDDPFAIARLLLDSTVEVLALNATQWEPSHYAVPNTALASHRLNNALLAYLSITDVPSLMGGVDRLYDWGDLAQPSAAALEIVRRAEALSEGERLPVIALGALTNVASAILLAPATAPKIDLYWLGSKYDFDGIGMTKRDFNCVMDVQALEEVLNSEIALHILPVSEASVLQFTYDEVREQSPPDHPFTGFLLRLWEDHRDGGRLQRILWDIGIVELFLHPELAESVEVPLPRANGERLVTYYRNLDVNAIKADFWNALRTNL